MVRKERKQGAQRANRELITVALSQSAAMWRQVQELYELARSSLAPSTTLSSALGQMKVVSAVKRK